MNALEARLHYPLGDTLPAPGDSLEVAPGVRWLRMALPFALDHINLWLLRDRDGETDGWTLVDCGIDNPPTRAAWEQVFATQLDGLPVLRVIATHMHPDHLGLAHWLTERWSCRLWISATDWSAAQLAVQSTLTFGGEAAAAHFRRHGLLDAEALDKVRRRSSYYASMVPKVPASFRRLMDGLVITIGAHDWRCLVGYGHAPEHMSLYCDALGVLISGDMVLPRISTNVSVSDLEPEGDPLTLYLRSVASMRALPKATRVLPSHGKPFSGLHERIDQLHAHHDERFADVLAACARGPQSAADLLPVLFHRKLDLHQTTFAMGESIAHLHALAGQGRVTAVAGDDGVIRYRLAAGADTHGHA